MKPIKLGLTNDSWNYLVTKDDNLLGIKRFKTYSKTTEIHILRKDTDFSTFKVNYTSGLSLRGNFDFLLDSEDNLICIKKTRNNFIEVHILSKISYYLKFILHKVTPLLSVNKIWAFCISKNNNDLYCLDKSNESGNLEIFVLSSSSNYTEISNTYTTNLPSCNIRNKFDLNNNDDLVLIKDYKRIGDSKMEVHILSKESSYTKFILQKSLPLNSI